MREPALFWREDGSERELQTQLQDAWVVSQVRAQEAVSANLIVADAEIVGRRTRITCDSNPLGVIEDVEGFRTELE